MHFDFAQLDHRELFTIMQDFGRVAEFLRRVALAANTSP